MKTLFRQFSVFALVFGVAFNIQAQTFSLKQSHENGIYKKGQQIQVSLSDGNNITDTLWVKVLKNNNQPVFEKSIFPVSGNEIIYSGKFKEPCSVMVEARTKAKKQTIGMIVAPNKIKTGIPYPTDFVAYWNAERQKLNALRMEVKQKKVDDVEKGFECFDTEINCTGSKPARGYFAKPQNARVRSLPIVLLVHAAGVKGSWCRSKVEDAMRYAQMGKGALCFDLNAHGMLNGQPDEYYNNLEAGELKEYWAQGMDSRENFYFRGMYLRLMRTIEFLTRQPEWDGRRILVIGESQGGGQALAAAGLDPRVSAVVATVPAMCDWGGTLVGRKGGWPQPFEWTPDQTKLLNVLPYFDDANLLKFSRAEIVVEIGLIDQTCPSTSVYAALNEAEGKKTIYPVTYREHGWPNEIQRKDDWDKNVFGAKNQFVENYLK
ncbi:MAG: acetylxylan esterase [Prolixibacteraceae bacterium]|jgi:cephalosporin-C deacetylase-like acetyl esterase